MKRQCCYELATLPTLQHVNVNGEATVDNNYLKSILARVSAAAGLVLACIFVEEQTDFDAVRTSWRHGGR